MLEWTRMDSRFDTRTIYNITVNIVECCFRSQRL